MSDEDAARDFLENLPPPPDDSQAPPYTSPPPDHIPDLTEPARPSRVRSPRHPQPVEPPRRPSAQSPAPSPRPVEGDRDAAPKNDLAPASQSLQHVVPQKPAPVTSDFDDTFNSVSYLFLGFVTLVCVGVVIAFFSWSLSYKPPLPSPTPSPTPAPTPAPEQVDGPYTVDDVRKILGDIPYAPVPTMAPQQFDGSYTADDVKRMLGDVPYASQPAPSSSRSSSGSGSGGGGHTTNEAIGPLSRTVYWTSGGKSYHFDPNCSHLSRSDNVLTGTLAEAMDKGKTDPCDDCVPQ